MTYYTINIKGYALAGCNNVKEFYELRKTHLKITSVKWIVVGVEIDPYYIDCAYQTHTPILLFLN